MKQKRLLAIHDISCMGRCSLTVALPIISAAGVECSILPTAILSTHTGGFENYTFNDLTHDMIPTINHWNTYERTYDCVYSGYLGSLAQIDILKEIIQNYKDKNPTISIIVDPVMGDNGSLYPLFNDTYVAKMRELIHKADVIVPNLTEACLLLDIPYKEKWTEEELRDICIKLTNMGAHSICLTGISFDEQQLGCAVYDIETKQLRTYLNERIPGYFHGTGDVFGSVLSAGLSIGLGLYEAASVAVDFTLACIKRTQKDACDIRYGVEFEYELYHLKADLEAKYSL